MSETSRFEKKIHEISSFYEWNGIKCPCTITEISSASMKMIVKGCLETGDSIKVKAGNENIPARVGHVNGEDIELYYKDVPQNQLNYIFGFVLELSKSSQG